MPIIGIELKLVKKENNKDVIFPEYQEKENVHQALVQKVAIIEGGMNSGKASLMFVAEVDDRVLALELSASHYKAIHNAFIGLDKVLLDDNV